MISCCWPSHLHLPFIRPTNETNKKTTLLQSTNYRYNSSSIYLFIELPLPPEGSLTFQTHTHKQTHTSKNNKRHKKKISSKLSLFVHFSLCASVLLPLPLLLYIFFYILCSLLLFLQLLTLADCQPSSISESATNGVHKKKGMRRRKKAGNKEANGLVHQQLILGNLLWSPKRTMPHFLWLENFVHRPVRPPFYLSLSLFRTQTYDMNAICQLPAGVVVGRQIPTTRSPPSLLRLANFGRQTCYDIFFVCALIRCCSSFYLQMTMNGVSGAEENQTRGGMKKERKKKSSEAA